MEYKIVKVTMYRTVSGALSALEREVGGYIRQGWEPTGPPSATEGSFFMAENPTAFQALVRDKGASQ